MATLHGTVHSCCLGSVCLSYYGNRGVDPSSVHKVVITEDTSVCVPVCVFMYVCVCVCTCMCVCTNTIYECVCVFTLLYSYTCTHVHVKECACTWKGGCTVYCTLVSDYECCRTIHVPQYNKKHAKTTTF